MADLHSTRDIETLLEQHNIPSDVSAYIVGRFRDIESDNNFLKSELTNMEETFQSMEKERHIQENELMAYHERDYRQEHYPKVERNLFRLVCLLRDIPPSANEPDMRRTLRELLAGADMSGEAALEKLENLEVQWAKESWESRQRMVGKGYTKAKQE